VANMNRLKHEKLPNVDAKLDFRNQRPYRRKQNGCNWTRTYVEN